MRPHHALSLVLTLLLASTTHAQDAAEDAYRYLAGLAERGLHERAASEAEEFLERYPDHAKASLARYRLGSALFELDRPAEALTHFETLARVRGFEFQAESAFRLGQCLVATGEDARAAKAFEQVLAADQDYLKAPATFLLGEVAFRARDFPAAARRYEALLNDYPDAESVPEARRGLVWCAWETHDVPRTIELARRFLERHAEHASADEVRIVLGEALLEAERPDDALAVFDSVREGDLADAARRGAGFAHAARGEHEEAAREFRALLDGYPQSEHRHEAALQEGVQLWKAGKTRQAVRALSDRELARDPEALYWLAKAQDADGDARGALATLERALSQGPPAETAQRLQIARGELLARTGSDQAALSAFEQAGSDYALYAGAVTGLNGGEPEEAARLARALLDTHRESPYRTETRLVLGESLFALGRHAEARREFEAVLQEDPSPELRARALSRAGWCHYREGDPAAAARRFRELLEAVPDAAEAEEAQRLLGRTLFESGQTEQARAAWERHLARFPDSPERDDVLFALALAEEPPAARGHLEELLAQHPESELVPEALLRLGDLLAAAGEHEAAVERYRELCRDHPKSEHAGAARYGLGWSLYELGQAREAARELDRAAADPSTSPELAGSARELAVWAHAAADDPEGAVASWRAFLQDAGDERALDAARTVLDAQRRAGRGRQSQAVLDELLAHVQDPGVKVAVLVEGAYVALDQGELDRAEAQVRVAERAAEGRPDAKASVAEASFFVGEARFEEQDLDRAVDLYARAARGGGPHADRALYKLGFSELTREDLPAAEEAFAALVDEHPESELRGEGLFLLGETRFRRGRFEEACTALETLLRESPKHEVAPKALFRLGLAQAHLERWSDAERTLSKLAREHEDFPNATEAELWRGKALAAQNKGTPARQAFERVLASDRGELAAEARLSLGRMYEAERRNEDALAEYLKVAVLFGQEEKVAEALYRAGLCLEALGEPDQAAARYRELVKEHAGSSFADAAERRLGGGSR